MQARIRLIKKKGPKPAVDPRLALKKDSIPWAKKRKRKFKYEGKI